VSRGEQPGRTRTAPSDGQQASGQTGVDCREAAPGMDELDHAGERVGGAGRSELGQELLVLPLDRGQVPGLRDESRQVAAKVLQFCRTALPAFKRPRRVIFTDGYPTTATGKIRRVELRVMATASLADV
jgi:acyl-CoA synthetase (AMP-forming)/AMP-acid ligase II